MWIHEGSSHRQHRLDCLLTLAVCWCLLCQQLLDGGQWGVEDGLGATVARLREVRVLASFRVAGGNEPGVDLRPPRGGGQHRRKGQAGKRSWAAVAAWPRGSLQVRGSHQLGRSGATPAAGGWAAAGHALLNLLMQHECGTGCFNHAAELQRIMCQACQEHQPAAHYLVLYGLPHVLALHLPHFGLDACHSAVVLVQVLSLRSDAVSARSCRQTRASDIIRPSFLSGPPGPPKPAPASAQRKRCTRQQPHQQAWDTKAAPALTSAERHTCRSFLSSMVSAARRCGSLAGSTGCRPGGDKAGTSQSRGGIRPGQLGAGQPG